MNHVYTHFLGHDSVASVSEVVTISKLSSNKMHQ